MNMAEDKSGQQQSLDGFGRPSIPKLSASCLRVLKLEDQKAKIVDKLSAAVAENDKNMIEARDDGSLEKDKNGDHVFVFENGSKPKVCVVKRRDVCTFRDKANLEDKPDLEVIDGGKGGIG